MKDNKKIFILMESILAVMLIILVIQMFLEKSGESRYKIAVVIQNSDSSQWASFKYGLKMAAEDQNIELSIVSTGENLTTEEEQELIRSEMENGADAVIVQPAPGQETEEMLRKMEKKIPVMLVVCAASGEEESSLLPVTGPDNYEIGKGLAEELWKDYGKNIEGKVCGILSEDDRSQAALSREQGLREVLETRGVKVRWSVSGSFAEEGEEVFPQAAELMAELLLRPHTEARWQQENMRLQMICTERWCMGLEIPQKPLIILIRMCCSAWLCLTDFRWVTRA